MTSDSWVHGGDVDRVTREFGIPATELIDFSASINPAGAPASVLARLAQEVADPRLLARYPDPTYAELRTALSRHLDVSAASLTIANGSAAIFDAVVRAFAPGRSCLLAVPAFGEQRRALGSAGCTIEPFRLAPSDGFLPKIDTLCQLIETRRPALCLLTNPHNPSGALMPAVDVLRVLRTAERAGTRLLLDEAFIDYAAAESVVREAAQSAHLIVVRSLTKFYGMPALRVGYAVSAPAEAAQMAAHLPSWPVTTIAADAATKALTDHHYVRGSLDAVAIEREWLRSAIEAAGFHVYPSAGNFLLVQLPEAREADIKSSECVDSTQLRAQLIREHHIIVRDCRSFDGMEDGRFIRVAVRTRPDNIRLAEALRAALSGARPKTSSPPELPSGLPVIECVDAAWIARAEARQRTLTKPPGSLGRLEEVANRVAAIQQSLTPSVERARIVVFAADHGVTAEGIAPYPSDVTRQMVANFLAGGAGVNTLARVAGAEVHVVDIGIAGDLLALTGLHQRRIANGTKNLAREAAMTSEQARAAIAVGMEIGRDVIAAGADMIGLGEMGIGNSTAASAVTAALTGLPASAVTGRGTGADDAMLDRKIAVIEQALLLHRPNRDDAFEVLRTVGGFELAGLVGLALAAAAGRKVVVADGFIATAAVAIALRLCPATADYLFAAHRAPEPGHAALLRTIGQEPLLDLGMRLGEGTGAALAFTLIRGAVAAFTGMATFSSAGVSNRPQHEA